MTTISPKNAIRTILPQSQLPRTVFWCQIVFSLFIYGWLVLVRIRKTSKLERRSMANALFKVLSKQHSCCFWGWNRLQSEANYVLDDSELGFLKTKWKARIMLLTEANNSDDVPLSISLNRNVFVVPKYWSVVAIDYRLYVHIPIGLVIVNVMLQLCYEHLVEPFHFPVFLWVLPGCLYKFSAK